MNDFFKKNDRMRDRHADISADLKARKFVLRDMVLRAVENKDKNFSIVETSIALGLYERKNESP